VSLHRKLPKPYRPTTRRPPSQRPTLSVDVRSRNHPVHRARRYDLSTSWRLILKQRPLSPPGESFGTDATMTKTYADDTDPRCMRPWGVNVCGMAAPYRKG
jgi:hypothetical protein